MRKLLTLFLAVMMLIALPACGKAEIPSGKPEGENAPLISSEHIEPENADTSADEDGKYKNTVTVSSIQELVEEIGNDTRILLKAGEYNFTELVLYEFENPHVRTSSSVDNWEYVIYGVNNMSIEAEEGAAVEIVTENPYTRPLSFSYCSEITLKGFSCGHKAEPGSCSGSVIYAERTSGLTIEECLLYGCGTYGLDTYESNEINVIGTEIYECSEGIVCMYDTYQATFNNCSFHDNTGGSLFSMNNCYNVVFEDTEMRNNNSGLDGLLDTSACDEIYFRNCVFSGNANEPNPEALSEIATFENCTISPPITGTTNETTDEHVGYVTLSEDNKDGDILLSINEVVWINSSDEALMQQYGFTYEDMANDYAIVDEDTTAVLYRAQRDTTIFSILTPDPTYGIAVNTEVSADEFVNALNKQGDQEMLVTFKLDEKEAAADHVLASIAQRYVP